MRARHDNPANASSEAKEEVAQLLKIGCVQSCEAWEWRPPVPIKGLGIRHVPPLPCRSLRCSPSVYSTRPYGGSVTTAWMLSLSRRSSQSKQSS